MHIFFTRLASIIAMGIYFISRVCTGHGRSHASLVDPDLARFRSAWMDLSSAHYSNHSYWTWEAQECHDTIALVSSSAQLVAIYVGSESHDRSGWMCREWTKIYQRAGAKVSFGQTTCFWTKRKRWLQYDSNVDWRRAQVPTAMGLTRWFLWQT
jgi:hypothetical protein